MKIPTSFQLFGQTIRVEMVEDLLENEDATGVALYRKNMIQLQCPSAACNRPPVQAEATFCHELMHWIFYVIGEDELRKNEKLVDLIGRLLHQALSTMVYEDHSA